MAAAYRSGGSFVRPASDNEGSRRVAMVEATSDVEPMSEEPSEDGAYRTAVVAGFDGPAAWTDVDQDEVCYP